MYQVCISFFLRWDPGGAVQIDSFVEEWIEAGARWIGKFLSSVCKDLFIKPRLHVRFFACTGDAIF